MATENFTVRDDEYWQGMGIEYIPTGFLDGNPMGYRQINAKMRVREIVTEYRGYDSHAAILSATNGLAKTIQQQTKGTAIITKYDCRVSRPRINEAGFWRASVTRKFQALYINDVWDCGCAPSTFSDESPTPPAS